MKKKKDSGIIKAEDLPEKEKVFLKKSFDGWHIVYPWKNEDGTTNWFNLLTGGSYWNLVKVAVIVTLILGVIIEYTSTLKYCADLVAQQQPIQINLN